MTARAFLLVLSAALAATAALADPPAGGASAGGTNSLFGLGKHNNNAPIAISADAFDGDINTKEGTWSGNVIVTQGDMKLRSNQMRVFVVEGKPNKIEANGSVVLASASGIATGDSGTYDLVGKTVTLSGKQVVLSKEKNVMKGTLLVVNLTTGQARFTAKGMGGGRVQSLIVPEKTTKPGGK